MSEARESRRVRRIKRNVISEALSGETADYEDDDNNDDVREIENNGDYVELDELSNKTKPIERDGSGGGGGGGAIRRTRRRRRVNDRPTSVALPGGSATLEPDRIVGRESAYLGRNIGALPRALTYHIRAYLDVLFGAVETERLRLLRRECYQSDIALPNVISSVLRYNNIAFKSVTMTNTRIPLPEPLWYDIDLANSHLSLYLYQPMYDSFCTSVSRLPVIVSSGVIKLEDYNPVATHPLAREQLDTATFNCAIVADHVAQHIISDVLQGDKKVPGADIHDRYNDVGTTLHSMLAITITGVQQDSARCVNDSTHGGGEFTSYFTLLGGSGDGGCGTRHDAFPFTYGAS